MVLALFQGKEGTKMFELTVLALGLGLGGLALLPISRQASDAAILVSAVCALITALLYHGYGV